MVEIKALIVEDYDDDAFLLVREIERSGYSLLWERVEDASGLRFALDQKEWDLIICDHSMPGFSSLDALAILKSQGIDIPFIIVSGTIGEEVAVAAMRAGAQDYIIKDDLKRLVPAIERELREVEVRRERKFTNTKLAEQDALFRAVVSSATDSIVIFDVDGTIQSVNPAVEKLFGCSAEQLVGSNIQVLFSDEQSVLFDLFPAKMSALSSQPPREHQARRYDGTSFPIELNITQVECETYTLYTATIRDISLRKQTELDLRRQLDRTNALRLIDVAITASLNLHVTLHVLLEQVKTQLGVDAAAVLLLRPETQKLEYVAGLGFRSAERMKDRVFNGETLATHAVIKDSVFHFNRHSKGSKQASYLTEEGFAVYYAVPLTAKQRILGVLEVYHRSPMQEAEDGLEFLEAFATQAAIAIENAQMYETMRQSNEDLQLAYDQTLEGWSKALDLRDRESEGHSQRVMETTLRLARLFGLPEGDMVHLRRGALLHDMGKLAIPDSILLKPGPLTENEWAVMKMHPVYAHDMLYPIEYLRPALNIPYCHHEKWDGSGYPRGLSKQEIPLEARVFAVVDVWDALSSDRPYRQAWPKKKVREHLASLAGTHFEPEIVQTFLQIEDECAESRLEAAV